MWGELASGALSIGAGLFGSSSNRKNVVLRRNRGHVTLDNILSAQQGFATQEQGYLQQALAALQGGYGAALGATSAIGRGARQRVLDRERQQIGSIGQGLVDRGLYNTTLGANLERGVRSDTDRALLDIDQALAAIQSNILGQQGSAAASGFGALANFYRNRSRDVTDVQNKRFTLLTDILPQSQTSFDFGGIGSFINSLF